MLICGVETDDLGGDFAVSESGKTLIIDGDGPAYVAAATVKTVATGLRRFQTEVLKQMFLADCSSAEVFLTHEECTKAGRFNVIGWKPYQGQRSGGAKPPLLSQVREIAYAEGSMDEFTVHMETVVEADDAMMMLAYSLKENGVIRSDDKDLRMGIFPYYDIKRGVVMPSDSFGELWLDETPSGAKKMAGRSLKFFWSQMVTGDSADNVRGLDKYKGKNVGLVGAFDWLHPINNIGELSNSIIDAYRAIDQNPLPEAWMLWLLRSPTDNVWAYFNELEWSPQNRRYLEDCVHREWFVR